MNKKIFVLAFASTAFLFGCSADYAFTSNTTPPEWSGTPSTEGPLTEPEPPPEKKDLYCDLPGYEYCVEIDGEQMTLELCRDSGGTAVSKCPDYSH